MYEMPENTRLEPRHNAASINGVQMTTTEWCRITDALELPPEANPDYVAWKADWFVHRLYEALRKLREAGLE